MPAFVATFGRGVTLPHSIRELEGLFPCFILDARCGAITLLYRVFTIIPVTSEGEVTARLLKLNLDQRVAERRMLAAPWH